MNKEMSSAFQRFLSISAKRREIYGRIAPVLTDVSLRDGLQFADPDHYGTIEKKDLFHTILFQENPQHMEVGALVSNKILPIMSDSLEIHKYAANQEWTVDRNILMDLFQNETETPTLPLNSDYSEKHYYLLVGSLKKLPLALQLGVKHFSFITSVSNPFQKKNVNITIEETKTEFDHMFRQYKELENLHTKLYISCIRECPIGGPIELEWIVKEILYYHERYSFQEICLSDTCGTLKYDDFKYIVETVKIFGLPYSKISLHLHTDPESFTETVSILRYCFKHGIRKFDVSLLNMGGCPVKERASANLSYEQFYEILKKYIEVVE
jgi:isopropylmalate/homocitrate/citramalate synthase